MTCSLILPTASDSGTTVNMERCRGIEEPIKVSGAVQVRTLSEELQACLAALLGRSPHPHDHPAEAVKQHDAPTCKLLA